MHLETFSTDFDIGMKCAVDIFFTVIDYSKKFAVETLINLFFLQSIRRKTFELSHKRAIGEVAEDKGCISIAVLRQHKGNFIHPA